MPQHLSCTKTTSIIIVWLKLCIGVDMNSETELKGLYAEHVIATIIY